MPLTTVILFLWRTHKSPKHIVPILGYLKKKKRKKKSILGTKEQHCEIVFFWLKLQHNQDLPFSFYQLF